MCRPYVRNGYGMIRTSLRRQVAKMLCLTVQIVLPKPLQPWGQAIEAEVNQIANPTEALMFAISGLAGLMPHVAARYWINILNYRTITALDRDGTLDMDLITTLKQRPQLIGLICVMMATALGIGYLAIAQAPVRHMGMNGSALVLGLILLPAIGAFGERNWQGRCMLAAGTALMAVALWGARVEGAARWLKLGPLFIQPSLILLPAMLLTFSKTRNVLTLSGIVIAALAMAIQPDRAMAGMMLASISCLAFMHKDRYVYGALGASMACFTGAMIRVDTLPASPFVDQIVFSSFNIHPVAGFAVFAGLVLLVVPAILGSVFDPQKREVYFIFGCIWLSLILAATLGNYPTPVVGYGGSAILGYVISLFCLPKTIHSEAASFEINPENADDTTGSSKLLRSASYS
jgi:hypothetical protein